MTKYATMNPLGSTSPYDLFDNAQNFDFAANSVAAAIWQDRLGRNRKTLWGMEQDSVAQLLTQEQRFNAFIQTLGYDVIGEYTSGPLTIHEYSELIRYENEFWKLNASTNIPFTTTGNDAVSWAVDSVHFVSVGDAALRSELASPAGAGLVGACLSVEVLRATEPSANGQRITVSSYYNNWAAIAGGEPKYGGQFWHDASDTTTPDDGFKCFVTTGGKRWKRVKGVYSVGHAGAVEDKNTESTTRIQAAIDGTQSGHELRFEGGPFNFDKVTLSKAIILTADADLTHNGFRIKSSNVTSKLSGLQKCRNYQNSSRAFEIYANLDGADYENIQILHNNFEGFFYSTAFIARDYSLVNDPNARTLKNTKIIGCTSKAPSGVDAGHFQHIGVTNAETSHCSTYGGQNATSYNFINQNGYVRVIGNYDQNNSYGSCELENSTVSNSVIGDNTFGSDLWVDDTSNVTVSGNNVAAMIRITSETADVRNLNVSSNTAKRIRVEQFGASPVGLVYDTLIASNTLTGADAGGTDLFLGALVTGEVASNICSGPSTHIGVTRRAATNLTIRNNKGKGGTLLIGGTGGRVIEYGNDTMLISGVSDSKFLADLMRPSKDYLDVPGMYLHGTKFTGSITPGATAALALPVPLSADPTFRGVALWVLIRDAASGNMSSFRIDGRYVVFGSVQLAFGTAYSVQGVDSGAITVSNNASTTGSINILITNTSGSKTLQVTVMPEVSSRLGIEE